jgi:7,8-dihydropterin-6-yl-methyl-4-(beta-D-ribofuranosyl)aminobenzene 5'-phosphate synthase
LYIKQGETHFRKKRKIRCKKLENEMKKLSRLSFLILLIAGVPLLVQNLSLRSAKAEQVHVTHGSLGDMSAIPLKHIQIAVVYDNNPYKEGFPTAWGFACLVKGAAKTILFDTGGNDALLLANMNKLGINPKEIDLVFLSHIHGDHVGGLKGFLQENKNVTVFFPHSFPAYFKADLAAFGVQTVEIRDPALICKSVYSTGELGIGIKEQSLIIHTDKGLILITGCAHPGIENIVKAVRNLIEAEVLLAMGGFHLGAASRPVIEEIVCALEQSGVRYVGPCHCSGDLARQLFKTKYGNRYIDVGVGRIIQFE